MENNSVLPVAFPRLHHFWIHYIVSPGGCVQEVKQILDSWRQCVVHLQNVHEQVVDVLLKSTLLNRRHLGLDDGWVFKRLYNLPNIAWLIGETVSTSQRSVIEIYTSDGSDNVILQTQYITDKL